MCGPCVEAARRAAAAASSPDSNGVTPMERRYPVGTPTVAPQPKQGNVVPVVKSPVTIPHDLQQMAEKKKQVEKAPKLVNATIKTPE